METFEQALTGRVERATTVRVTAVPLEGPGGDHPLSRGDRVPIIPCLCVCVTDPCDCCDGDSIWWITNGSIRKRESSGRRSSGGEDLYTYYVDPDAEIVVEKISSASARALTAPKPKGGARTPGRIDKCVPFPTGGPSALRMAQECAGGTLWDVYETVDSDGGTVFIYHAVGSC
ncbi:hypothetical protein [Streptomyces sp. NPDC005752]|uniref:hypothetical protein n=1 Tax=Streptomyces sp. NPDC005752 TaxID=3157065 RepID=UPI0033FD466F